MDEGLEWDGGFIELPLKPTGLMQVQPSDSECWPTMWVLASGIYSVEARDTKYDSKTGVKVESCIIRYGVNVSVVLVSSSNLLTELRKDS